MLATREVSKSRTLKAEEQAEARKRAFFEETIKIVLSEPKCTWTVQRVRLTPEFLQQLIDGKIPELNVTPAYLKSMSGAGIIVPFDMRRLCDKKETYELILHYPIKTHDFKAKSAGYKGESQFVFRNVPSFSQNNLHLVEAYHLMEWIRHSLLKEDPKILSIDKSITALKKALESAAHLIKNAAENPIVNERGIIMTGKQADKKRQARYDRMLKSKHDIRSQLEDTEADRRQIYNIKYDEIRLSATFLKANEWKVEIFGEQKQSYENILLNKRDWNTTFLHAYPMDLDPQLRSLDSEYLVDIGCISVERVEHGFGCYHRPSHISSAQHDQNAHGKHVISYHGTYEDGLYQGLGFMFTDSYIYGGGFDKHLYHGQGTIIHKDGDVIRSEFGLNPLTSGKAHGNRYARGLPNGKSSITFADGAYYEGNLQNGIISGKGIYIGANGDRLEGEFVNGHLIRGTKKMESTGETFCGSYSDGLLGGLGYHKSTTKRSNYQGSFVGGMKHGLGEHTFYKKNAKETLAQYTGYFYNNRRSGIGSLELQDSGFGFLDVGKETLRVDGIFLAGESQSGGMVTNVNFHTCFPTTNRPSSKYRLLNRFKRVEEQKDNSIMRATLKSEYYDLCLRSTVESKKKDIFNYHHGRITESLNGEESPRMLSAREMRLPSQSKSYKKHMKVFGPHSIEQAEASPGLNTVLLETQESEDGIAKRILKDLEKDWTDMRFDFKASKMEMQVIQEQIDLMQEELNFINLAHLQEAALVLLNNNKIDD